MTDFQRKIREDKEKFENFLSDRIFPEIQNKFSSKLSEACLYSLGSGGKRIRPILVLAGFSSGANPVSDDLWYLATSVECIHSYSLIHDDLPAMDDDDFRRGKPTVHKKFDEATAILAGDALNSFAYYILSKVSPNQEDPSLLNDLLSILHDGSGGPGMVSGQAEDLANENNPEGFNEKTLRTIHSLKTGALILSSLLLGNRLRMDHRERHSDLKKYGENLGLLFQITDDILDEESSFQDLGKTPGKDTKSGKLTYPALYGMEKSKSLLNEISSEMEELSIHLESQEEYFFKTLPSYIVKRKN
ncbi:MAG: polyprenyl synthetase family protein [Leptospiraceae bacterium]|nr:polyprenyl synthetase family protein [Leptospiraceae bacterium]